MHRILDLGVPIFQVGVRSLSRPEWELRESRRVAHIDAATLAEKGIPATLLPAGFPDTVYLTFDLDALDPSLLPGTGTPEPGGLLWYDTLRLLEKAIHGRRVAGADMVELAPVPGLPASDFVAARLTYAVMGMINRLAVHDGR
jgi:agmatinase